MILEVAIPNIREGQARQFEIAFEQAQALIASMPGYVSHQLQRCPEVRDRYLLLVNWRQLEDHVEECRASRQYQEWKRLLHYFYEPFPIVEHYSSVFQSGDPGVHTSVL